VKRSRHHNPGPEAGGTETDLSLIARAQAVDADGRATADAVAARNMLILRHEHFIWMKVHKGITGQMTHDRRNVLAEQHYPDGVIAFIRCIELFDASRGFTLLTFAGTAIVREVWRARNMDTVVTRPHCPSRQKESSREQWFKSARTRRLHRRDTGENIDPASLVRRYHSPDHAGVVSDDDENRWRRLRIEGVLRSMGDRGAAARLVLLDGMTYPKVGKLFGLSRTWVYFCVEDARRLLRVEFEEDVVGRAVHA
jgi:hypothetical protein